jgi:hypothetical protein
MRDMLIAALSLNAVRTIAPKNRGFSANCRSNGSIHHSCKPPWITSPARKNATSNGVRNEQVILMMSRCLREPEEE